MVDSEAYRMYEAALHACGETVARAVRVLVDRCAYASDFEKALLEGYASVVSTFGAAAANAALEFYAAARAAAMPSGEYEPKPYPADVANLLPLDVAQAVAAHPADFDALAAALSGKAERRVVDHAEQTIYSNALRDPARPKWAIVPTPGACDWCVMIGSRGFEYASESSAKRQRHDSCRCAPVVDFDAGNPRLEGYDVDALKAYYDENLKEKWGRRSGGRRGGKRPPAVPGLDSIGDVQRFVGDTESLEDMAGRSALATQALKHMFGTGKEYEKAASLVAKSAAARYRQLKES